MLKTLFIAALLLATASCARRPVYRGFHGPAYLTARPTSAPQP